MDSNKKYSLLLMGLTISLATQIFGFFLLWNKADQREYVYVSAETGQGPTAEGQATPVVTTLRFPDEAALRASIQSILKQELQSYRQTVSSETTPKISTAETPQVVENTPANLQALSASTSVVSGALAKKVWTREDSTSLMQHASQLTRAQRDEIMEKIVGAINRQELTPMDIPPGL